MVEMEAYRAHRAWDVGHRSTKGLCDGHVWFALDKRLQHWVRGDTMLKSNVKFSTDIRRLHGKEKQKYGPRSLVGIPIKTHRQQEREYKRAQLADAEQLERKRSAEELVPHKRLEKKSKK